jgi:signal transduction histidine kinase/DNA-binding response OmpR family regulator
MSKILAIDDKLDNLISISALLKALIPNCNIITAQSGAEGILKAENELPDTILLDIKMPEMDGYEVCNRLKGNEKTQHIPVIMISAIRTGSEDLVEGLNSGADAYLSKPIDEYVLVAQVKTALRIKKAEDHLRHQKDQLESMVQERTKELECLYNISSLIETPDLLFEEIIQGIVNFFPGAMNYPENTFVRIKLNDQEFMSDQFIETESKQSNTIIVNGQQKGVLDFFLSQEVINNDNVCYLKERNDFIYNVVNKIEKVVERIEAKEEKKKLEEQLFQAQKMESLGLLAGGIAHDFNNILFAIMGNTQIALYSLPEDTSIKRLLNEVMNAIGRAKEMVQQILAFSRQYEAEKKSVNVQFIVKEVLKLLKTSIPSTITIRHHIDTNAGQILADPSQIHQIIMNLATNAYHAMEKNGGILEVNLSQVELTADEFIIDPDIQVGQYVKLTISDTGHGISKDIIGKIFDPYFTTKEVGKGSGLGLSLVHGIVKNHRGTITIDSQEGKGSVFTILLPIIEKTVADQSETTGELLLGKETILFVDDDETIAKMMKQMMKRIGYQIEICTSSVEALELFQTKSDQFDIVITDMTMPQMTGDILAEKLRKIRNDIPIIICTGHSALIDEEKSRKMGMLYIMKPITMVSLAKTIREALCQNQK